MSAIEYRPALDGLRAVAVIAVMLFHLDPGLLPGGFVGVDVFFVLSGYLITSIILVERDAGKFSYARFYQRRIARILPAAMLVIVATLIAAWRLYSPQDFASAGAVAMAAALSVANMKLMLQGNYFEVSPDAQPFLHFWSLAIEEQFYLFLPIVVGIFYRNPARRRILRLLLSLGAIASLVGCIIVTSLAPTWAFYLLPTRAWELLAGCLLATRAIRTETTGMRRAAIAKTAGFLMILGSCFLIHEGDHFPGWVAIAPVAGACLCIGRRGSDGSTVERLLARKSMVTIGKMSYSLYLWHWPIFCFVDYSLYAESAFDRNCLKCVLTLILAGLAHYAFENPMRRSLADPRHRCVAYCSAAVSVIVVSVAGIQIRNRNYLNATLDSVRAGGIAINSSIDRPLIVLMGDSNGSMYGVTIREIAETRHSRANILSVAAADPFPPSRLYEDSLAFLENSRPDVLILVAAWGEKIGDKPESIQPVLQELLELVDHIIIVTQPPVLPLGTSRERFRENGVAPILEETGLSQIRRRTNEYLKSLADDHVHVIDIEDHFTTATGTIRFVDSRGRQLWHDRTHLSGYGTELVRQQLEEQIEQALSLSR